MQRTISPFLLFLQVATVSMLVAGAAFIVRLSDDGNYGLCAILYFGTAALVIPGYQLYLWACDNRKATAVPVPQTCAGKLRDSEDGVWPE